MENNEINCSNNSLIDTIFLLYQAGFTKMTRQWDNFRERPIFSKISFFCRFNRVINTFLLLCFFLLLLFKVYFNNIPIIIFWSEIKKGFTCITVLIIMSQIICPHVHKRLNFWKSSKKLLKLLNLEQRITKSAVNSFITNTENCSGVLICSLLTF